MSKDLGLLVVAEGIETELQRAFLARRTCDEIQGYLVSPPLPAGDFERFIRLWTRGRMARSTSDQVLREPD